MSSGSSHFRWNHLLIITFLLGLASCGTPSSTPVAPSATAGNLTPGSSPTALAQSSAPTTSPVATSVAAATSPMLEPSSAVPLPTLTSELSATVAAGLPPTATPKPGEQSFGGITGVNVLPLTGTNPQLFAVYSTGYSNFEPPQQHFVAIYQRLGEEWKELSRLELDKAGIILDNSVTQVQVAPGRTWIEVQSGTGAHGGCYDLLSFDGKALNDAVSSCHASPDAGWLKDLNSDGTPEVVLNQTDDYVFCYACGERFIQYQVLRWDGDKFVEVSLEMLPDSAPAKLHDLINQAVTLAQAGLWKDAQTTISQTLALNVQDPTATWDAALIRLTAEARADQVTRAPYPVLDNVFYGDYAAALRAMRSYSPEQIFSPDGPLIADTPAEGFVDSLTDYLTRTTTLALNAKPDLAAAFFLRGWGYYLHDPKDPNILADVQHAATLDPKEHLFVQSVAYLKQHKAG